MKGKWVSLIFVALVLASCATLTYSKPPWGTSKDAYPIANIPLGYIAGSLGVYEVPAENYVRLAALWDVHDRGGDLDKLRLALNKYFEWKEQLKGTGGKVSKPITEITIFYPQEENETIGVHYDDMHTLALSFQTAQDGKYFLQITLMTERSLGGGYYSDPVPGDKLFLFEDQVTALSQALSQDNILAKAKEADEIANQKVQEDSKNQALQNSLQ